MGNKYTLLLSSPVSLSRTSSSLNKRAQVVIWRRARCQSVGVRRLQICLSGCFPLLLYYFDYLFLLELDATRHFIRLPSLFLTCLPLPLLFFIEQIIIWFRKHVALTPKSDRAVYVKMEWDDGSSRFLALIGLIYDVCQGGKKTLCSAGSKSNFQLGSCRPWRSPFPGNGSFWGFRESNPNREMFVMGCVANEKQHFKGPIPQRRTGYETELGMVALCCYHSIVTGLGRGDFLGFIPK